MSDRWTFALAGAVCSGAVLAWDLPLVLGLAGVVVALVLRWPALLAVGGFVLASALAVRADAGLIPPPPAPVEGEFVLLSDPTPFRGAVRAEVRVGRRRVEAWAHGAPAGALRDRLAGEVVQLEGRLGPVPERSRRYLHSRHVSGRLSVSSTGGWRPGSPVSRLANGLRRTLAQGAEVLGPDRRSLFLGMTIGDDRDQSVEVADDFRGAGLTHLLAVSGQNVAFVLALAWPLLCRLGLRSRWLATLSLLGFFALVTRFEPSVLRASAMAAVACTATWLGRPSTRLRLLALAVAALVVVDPLIVGSVGFRLSVGATLGISLLSAPLARHLPGPRPLAGALAVTLAAQAGVAPFLIPTFGGIPVASVPANLLAVPAAAPLMAWGLTGGMVAGLLGPPLDGPLHVPTGLLLNWVGAVARWATALPLGIATLRHVVALAVVFAAAGALVLWRHRTLAVTVGALGAALVLLSVGLLGPRGHDGATELTEGAELWRGQGVVMVIDAPDSRRLLEGLRLAGVRRLDVVVSRRGSRTAAATVALLRTRLAVGAVLAPEGHAVRDAFSPAAMAVLDVGDLRLTVESTRPTLDVTVVRSARARSPPLRPPVASEQWRWPSAGTGTT